MNSGIRKFNENLSFAEQPSKTRLQEWADAGYRTVVNLRPTAEVERGLRPAEEESLCGVLGLEYQHLPTSLDDLNEAHLRECSLELIKASTPLVVHCHGGARAAIVVAALHVAESGAPGQEVIKQIETTGQSFNPQLKTRVVRILDSLRLGRAYP